MSTPIYRIAERQPVFNPVTGRCWFYGDTIDGMRWARVYGDHPEIVRLAVASSTHWSPDAPTPPLTAPEPSEQVTSSITSTGADYIVANGEVKRVGEQAGEAVCHCGTLMKDHTIFDNHNPVELPAQPAVSGTPTPSEERIAFIKKMVKERAYPDGRLDDAVAKIFDLEHELAESKAELAKERRIMSHVLLGGGEELTLPEAVLATHLSAKQVSEENKALRTQLAAAQKDGERMREEIERAVTIISLMPDAKPHRDEPSNPWQLWTDGLNILKRAARTPPTA